MNDTPNTPLRRTFKYRLYPSQAQRTALRQALDACRWVHNKTLEVRRDAWQERQESLSLYDTQKQLTQWIAEEPWLKRQAYSQNLQNVCVRVDLAFKAFFRRVKAGEEPGYPRFRGYERYDSFTYPQSGFEVLDNGRLRLAKIGYVKIKLHRPIAGKVKTLTIRRDRLGNWYACFSCEVEAKPLPVSPNMVGVDVGLRHFATLSDGRHIPNPRFFRRDEKALAKAQRRLSRCKQGTAAYRQRKRVINHIHQRIANRRRDFAHKVSRQLVNDFQVIAFEDLDIQDMQDGNYRGMNKSISDVAWRQLREYTTYKAEDAGRSFVAVDPRNTTQMCSGCGRIVRKGLSERVHRCPHSDCGIELDRDHNSALNVLARGLACLGLDP